MLEKGAHTAFVGCVEVPHDQRHGHSDTLCGVVQLEAVSVMTSAGSAFSSFKLHQSLIVTASSPAIYLGMGRHH